ncbi:sodium:glutamate symporter [Bacillus coahuilensis]|uniref:sodium:glutamate symporter n=1 Tax=Bacillus coahuilensis TaxID=408580 RepID=UPI0001850A46|nr:sodium:glutamate symporter [Bacillus coahuilensis]
MMSTWLSLLDLMYLSLFILITAILKARVSFFKKMIVPTSMIAGFLGLLVGPELLGLFQYNLDTLGTVVYHLMAIGFIAISLKERKLDQNRPEVVNAGIFIVSNYLIQGIIGLGLLLVLGGVLFPNVFPGIGLLLPLGFGQGPGQAYSIGVQWQELGIEGGGNLGLTFAGLGFVWATAFGMFAMNMLVKKGIYPAVFHADDVKKSKVIEEDQVEELSLSDAMDKLTYQIALIALIYLITYLTINFLSSFLQPLGTYGATLSQLLEGFHFLIGSLYAILFRIILNFFQKKNVHLEHAPNNYLLQRIAGVSFDYMITASIAAISLYALGQYLIPVLILTTAAGIGTYFYIQWLAPKLFKRNELPNILGFYGMLTGTISTGMALVKAVDPKFESNATDNMVMGSATAIVFGLPLMFILNLPIVGFIGGEPIFYTYTFLALIVYFIFLLYLLRIRLKKVA